MATTLKMLSLLWTVILSFYLTILCCDALPVIVNDELSDANSLQNVIHKLVKRQLSKDDSTTNTDGPDGAVDNNDPSSKITDYATTPLATAKPKDLENSELSTIKSKPVLTTNSVSTPLSTVETSQTTEKAKTTIKPLVSETVTTKKAISASTTVKYETPETVTTTTEKLVADSTTIKPIAAEIVLTEKSTTASATIKPKVVEPEDDSELKSTISTPPSLGPQAMTKVTETSKVNNLPAGTESGLNKASTGLPDLADPKTSSTTTPVLTTGDVLPVNEAETERTTGTDGGLTTEHPVTLISTPPKVEVTEEPITEPPSQTGALLITNITTQSVPHQTTPEDVPMLTKDGNSSGITSTTTENPSTSTQSGILVTESQNETKTTPEILLAAPPPDSETKNENTTESSENVTTTQAVNPETTKELFPLAVGDNDNKTTEGTETTMLTQPTTITTDTPYNGTEIITMLRIVNETTTSQTDFDPIVATNATILEAALEMNSTRATIEGVTNVTTEAPSVSKNITIIPTSDLNLTNNLTVATELSTEAENQTTGFKNVTIEMTTQPMNVTGETFHMTTSPSAENDTTTTTDNATAVILPDIAFMNTSSPVSIEAQTEPSNHTESVLISTTTLMNVTANFNETKLPTTTPVINETTSQMVNVTIVPSFAEGNVTESVTNGTFVSTSTNPTTEILQNSTTAAPINSTKHLITVPINTTVQPVTLSTNSTTLQPTTQQPTKTSAETSTTSTSTVAITTTTSQQAVGTNTSASVAQSQGLSASAMTAIITGSIIGFWIILGPIICLICKVRDKRKERYHMRLSSHSDPPVDNGMLDAMIISELKKTSESSHDNGTTKEKEYNTVANDKGETERLKPKIAEHEF